MIYITDGDGTKEEEDYEDNSGNDEGVSDDSDDSTIPSGDPSAEEEDSPPPHKKMLPGSTRGGGSPRAGPASKPVVQRDTVLRSGSGSSLIQEQHLPIVSAEMLRTLQNLPKVQSLQPAGHASVFTTAQLLGSLCERQAAAEGGVHRHCEQETPTEKLHPGQRRSQMEAPRMVSLTK